MGGELIARIIHDSEYAKKEGVNLILQPMSSIEELRLYLCEGGFRIIDESICESMGKLYQCINCTYDGKARRLTEAEKVLGRVNIEKGVRNPLFVPLLRKLISRTEFIISGKEKGGNDAEKEKVLLAELKAIEYREI